jgi:hypothetical protein
MSRSAGCQPAGLKARPLLHPRYGSSLLRPPCNGDLRSNVHRRCRQAANNCGLAARAPRNIPRQRRWETTRKVREGEMPCQHSRRVRFRIMRARSKAITASRKISVLERQLRRRNFSASARARSGSEMHFMNVVMERCPEGFWQRFGDCGKLPDRQHGS